MDNIILDIKNLTKSYNNIKALDNFSLSLKKSEIFGLLGPNGAGKTTLISILSGTLKDFSGTVYFKKQDLFSNRKLKNLIGIVPQDMAFYEELSAMDNLIFWGGLYGLSKKGLKKRAIELLKIVGLTSRAKEPIKNFSGGMKRRLNIAIGLIHKPELLLLDEPTVGIDVQATIKILEIIKEVGENGTSVIFTTHQLTEAEKICSNIGIMDKGHILANGTLEELIQIVGEKEIVDIRGEFPANSITKILKKKATYEILSVEDNFISMAFKHTDKIPSLLDTLFNNNILVTDLKIKSPNLETVFLKLTGRSLRD